MKTNWKKVKLGDLVKISKGKKEEEVIESDYRYIQIEDLRDDANIKFCSHRDKSVIVSDKDILIAWDGANAGTIGYGISGVIGSTIAKLEIQNIERISTDYLGRFLQSKFNYIQANSTGATIPHVSRDYLLSIEIPLPPLHIQKKIADALDKADEIRIKRQEAIDKLDELVQSVFLDMFGDLVKNDKSWDKKQLGEILKDSPQNGLYVPKDQYVENGGIKMIHMSDAFYGTARIENIKQISIDEKTKEKYSVNNNDLLIARRSLNFEGAAKPCFIPKTNEDLVFESSLIKITPDQKICHIQYLYYFLSNERTKKKYVFPYLTKSTISGINQTNLKKIDIPIPDIKLQQEFNDYVNKINVQKKEDRKAFEKIDNLFNSLMQKAFKGELEFN